jgi:DNA polymerase III delta prime subunit
MSLQALIGESLALPTNAIGFQVNQHLSTLFPDKSLLEGEHGLFRVEEYARAGMCQLWPDPTLRNQLITYWRGPGKGLFEHTKNGCFQIEWQGYQLRVVLMNWQDQMGSPFHFYILADIREIAENFMVAVCEWNMEVRGEVLVFDNGCWSKDEELYTEIKNATFDNLILQGSLKEQIRDDLSQFFQAQPTYERYKIPWKRGILFVGPPGNGKTHAIKALINHLDVPCLYVKSFQSQHPVDNYNIRQVFDRARNSAPCLLVLEDLDSLVTDRNRSFFLNELDGFATNVGIVTLASTNHPERLDPAIVDRPSRFDRKYHFALPEPAERAAYLKLWNGTLEPALRLSEAGLVKVAELTEGFSFAYLKELFLSAMMRWINQSQTQTGPEVAEDQTKMDEVMPAQIDLLREQMVSAAKQPPIDPNQLSTGAMGAVPPWRVSRFTSFGGPPGVIIREGFGPGL